MEKFIFAVATKNGVTEYEADVVGGKYVVGDVTYDDTYDIIQSHIKSESCGRIERYASMELATDDPNQIIDCYCNEEFKFIEEDDPAGDFSIWIVVSDDVTRKRYFDNLGGPLVIVRTDYDTGETVSLEDGDVEKWKAQIVSPADFLANKHTGREVKMFLMDGVK